MRLILGLLLAAALSLPIGLGASEIASLLPCRGEGLACNLDQAIGGYAVIIWSLLGPVIFGVILLVASNRIALRAGMLLLLAPLVAPSPWWSHGKHSVSNPTKTCARRSRCSSQQHLRSSPSGKS